MNHDSRSTMPAPSGHKINNRADYLDISSLFGKYAAGWIVARVVSTRIQVLEVTALAFVAGLAAAAGIWIGTPGALISAAILIQVKNIFDTVDGSLARARRTPSAIGRYADSVSDFLINAALFCAIAKFLAPGWGKIPAYGLAGAAFLSQSLQCSYYVFYTVRYLGSREPHGPLDERHPIWLGFFKICYAVIYGWQDRLVGYVDRARGGYRDKRFLFLTGFLGLGTQLFLMSVALACGRPGAYLWFMLGPANLYLIFLIFYRIYRGGTQ